MGFWDFCCTPGSMLFYPIPVMMFMLTSAAALVPTFTWNWCLCLIIDGLSACFITVLLIIVSIGIIMVIYTIYYDDWMWVQLLGPVGLRVAVLVGLVTVLDLS